MAPLDQIALLLELCFAEVVQSQVGCEAQEIQGHSLEPLDLNTKGILLYITDTDNSFVKPIVLIQSYEKQDRVQSASEAFEENINKGYIVYSLEEQVNRGENHCEIEYEMVKVSLNSQLALDRNQEESQLYQGD